MAAKTIRSQRLTTSNGSLLMVPMDHGVSMGPAAGIADPVTTMAKVADGGASCITVHKGLVRFAARFADRLGVLLHLSASTDENPDPNDKRIVATVEEALRLGCDGVSLHVNVGATTESRMVEDFGRISGACDNWGVPLLAMMYPRGPAVTNPHDADLVAKAARLGAELGADAVKVPYTGDSDSFRDVVAGCPVPVVISGGPARGDVSSFMDDIKGAKRAGATGVSVGRNIFQADDAAAAMRRVAEVFA